MDIQTFSKRLNDMCLGSGLTGLPRSIENRLLLLKSVALTLDRGALYTEKEINRLLRSWLLHIGITIQLDHVNLRRCLIDEGFLERTKDGSAYWMGSNPNGSQLFDTSVEACDPLGTILSGKSVREQRKIEYLQRTATN